jgi:cyclopropane fatty-acyl-phospholipid synthase-like methyltransferase
VLALGYSERFWRKYRFYFAYCEAAFDARCALHCSGQRQACLVHG